MSVARRLLAIRNPRRRTPDDMNDITNVLEWPARYSPRAWASYCQEFARGSYGLIRLRDTLSQATLQLIRHAGGDNITSEPTWIESFQCKFKCNLDMLVIAHEHVSDNPACQTEMSTRISPEELGLQSSHSASYSLYLLPLLME
ncbi:hypothetical protein F5Y06DRAFT_258265 [Hypoxylon sp. FL0890]|nr:hypothetical protein F5Y06DRAFT_258265 [Hypoxylon sp. FL0890]